MSNICCQSIIMYGGGCVAVPKGLCRHLVSLFCNRGLEKLAWLALAFTKINQSSMWQEPGIKLSLHKSFDLSESFNNSFLDFVSRDP